LSLAARQAGAAEAREITNKSLMRPGGISSTFHGRDIFGPVAGHLAAGAPFESVGPVLVNIRELALPKTGQAGKTVLGTVLHIDDYGNLLTNIPAQMVEEMGVQLGSDAQVTVGPSAFVARFAQTYSDVPEGEYLFLNNRTCIEIALNQRHLAETIGAAQGMEVSISLLTPSAQ
jgi:hypothetical protein